MARRTTIADVAEYSGVSPSTVSHVLTGKRKISDEVAAKVQAAISHLDYRPSRAVQALAEQRTGMIGVVATQCSNLGSTVVNEIMQAELARHGYEQAIGIAGNTVKKGIAILTRFAAMNLDGIINMLPQVSSREAARLCDPMPVVTYQRQEDAPILVDDEGMTFNMMDYFWSLGHRKIGFIVDETKGVDAPEDPSFKAYSRFLENKGLPVDPQLVFKGSVDIGSGYMAAEQFVRAGATACFAGNDQMAVGVYQWAYANNVRIPDDLSVIGLDNSPLATAVFPQMTSIQLPLEEMVQHTVETLVAKIENRKGPQHAKLIQPRLILRKSTGPARQQDK